MELRTDVSSHTRIPVGLAGRWPALLPRIEEQGSLPELAGSRGPSPLGKAPHTSSQSPADDSTWCAGCRPALLLQIEEQGSLPGLLEAVDPEAGAAQLAAAAATAQASPACLSQDVHVVWCYRYAVCSQAAFRRRGHDVLYEPRCGGGHWADR